MPHTIEACEASDGKERETKQQRQKMIRTAESESKPAINQCSQSRRSTSNAVYLSMCQLVQREKSILKSFATDLSTMNGPADPNSTGSNQRKDPCRNGLPHGQEVAAAGVEVPKWIDRVRALGLWLFSHCNPVWRIFSSLPPGLKGGIVSGLDRPETSV